MNQTKSLNSSRIFLMMLKIIIILEELFFLGCQLNHILFLQHTEHYDITVSSFCHPTVKIKRIISE